MEKRIEGKRYNTKTARFITKVDRHMFHEELYVTKTGNYFIYSYTDDGFLEENIRALTDEQLDQWVEDYIGKDIVLLPEKKNKNTVQISAFIPKEIKAKLDHIRREKHLTLAEIIIEMANKKWSN